MITPAQAILLIAEATHFWPTPSCVAEIARRLRESDTSLWPQSKRGRGPSARLEPSHLTNLLLALCDIPSRAVRTVGQLRPEHGAWFDRNIANPLPEGHPEAAAIRIEFTRAEWKDSNYRIGSSSITPYKLVRLCARIYSSQGS